MPDASVPREAPFQDLRKRPRSPYVPKLMAMAVGDTLKAPAHHRTRLSVLASYWGPRLGKKFKTTRLGKTYCLIGRVA